MKKVVRSNNKLKIEFVIILAFGVFFIILGLGLLFGLYRPFVPWQKFKCTEAAGTLEFVSGDFNCLYRYTINEQNYEVIIKNYSTGHGGSTHQWYIENIYVNKNNHYDVKVGTYGTEFLILLICFILVGIGGITFAVWNYFNKQKKLSEFDNNRN